MNNKLSSLVLVVTGVLVAMLVFSSVAMAQPDNFCQKEQVASYLSNGSTKSFGCKWDNGPFRFTTRLQHGYIVGKPAKVILQYRYQSSAKFVYEKPDKRGILRKRSTTYRKAFGKARWRVESYLHYQWWSTEQQKSKDVYEVELPSPAGPGKLKTIVFWVTFPTCEQPLDEAYLAIVFRDELSDFSRWACNPAEIFLDLKVSIRNRRFHQLITIPVVQRGISVYPSG